MRKHRVGRLFGIAFGAMFAVEALIATAVSAQATVTEYSEFSECPASGHGKSNSLSGTVRRSAVQTIAAETLLSLCLAREAEFHPKETNRTHDGIDIAGSPALHIAA